VSNSDPQDEATQQRPWSEPSDAPASAPDPEEEAQAAPSWLGYPAESTEYTVPHTYTASGYADEEADEPGPDQYVSPPPPPAEHYAAPQYYDPPSADVPAGAGMVPPRAGARPPAPPADTHPTDEVPPAPPQQPAAAPPEYPAHYPAPNHHPGPSYPQQPQPGAPGQTFWPQAAPAAPAPAARPAAAPPPAAPPPPAAGAPPHESPRPEDLLVPDRPSISDAPATWGWRGRINKMSAGAIKPKAKPAELGHRKAVLDIQHGFSRPMTVVVIQPKGGAGKTPTTIGLAAALGAHRGGYVVGWDDNETRGTLAVRTVNRDSQRTTVWDFLGALPSFERLDARVGDLSYYVRSQGEAYFDALVSDDHPGNMAQIGEEEFRRIHAVLQRFYRIIVIDTGNNVRSPNWQAAVNAADVVVIPSTYQRDVGYSGSWVLDHLLQTGREDLAEHAVTVLTAADPTIDGKVRHELQRHFSARTQNVVEIPFDEHIATGGPIHWANLDDATRRAYTQLGAIVVSALVRRDLPQR
jgi:MinD-like ATPase involved in chromosome partitioning or flagellar assembly